MPLLLLISDIHQSVYPLNRRIRIINIELDQQNFLLHNISHDGSISTSLHDILVIHYSEAAQLGISLRKNTFKSVFKHNTVPAILLMVHQKWHALLTRGTAICLNHNHLAMPLCIGNIKQVRPGPSEVLRAIIEDFTQLLFIHHGIQVCISRNNPLITQREEGRNQRVDLSIEHSRVEMLLTLKVAGFHNMRIELNLFSVSLITF